MQRWKALDLSFSNLYRLRNLHTDSKSYRVTTNVSEQVSKSSLWCSDIQWSYMSACISANNRSSIVLSAALESPESQLFKSVLFAKFAYQKQKLQIRIDREFINEYSNIVT